MQPNLDTRTLCDTTESLPSAPSATLHTHVKTFLRAVSPMGRAPYIDTAIFLLL